MNVRIFAATEMEISPLRELLQSDEGQKPQHTVSFTITGPGLLSSTFQITKTLMAGPPDMMIQVGVAGSFSDTIPLESVVVVNREMTGDSGVQESGSFRDLFDMGLLEQNHFPFHQKKLDNPHLQRLRVSDWPLATGITVNEITTDPVRRDWLIREYGAEVESLEGAAFHYAGLMLGIPFVQVRAISNKVGERDKKTWCLDKAITASCQAVFKLISTL